MSSVYESIRAAENERTKPDPVKVPEWKGVTVFVRPLTCGELVAVQTLGRQLPKEQAYKADLALIAYAVQDADGNQVFAGPDQLDALSPKAVNRLLDAALERNDLKPEKAKGKGGS